MDSASRRETLIRLLRRSGLVPVAHLARELAVSRRTVLRDLRILRDRGFAILADSGRGGGVYLDPHSVLLSSQLAAHEVVALLISVAVMRAAPGFPFAAGAERALAKIEGALPAKRVRELRRFMQRILVGDTAFTIREQKIAPVHPALLACFEQAFTLGRVLRFTYVDRRGRKSRRRVEPHGLLVRPPLWYVVAWDLDRNDARVFRMDRIGRPAVQARATFIPRPIERLTWICPDARPATQTGQRQAVITYARVRPRNLR